MANIVGIIPARGDSKTVPMKNIKLLNGQPLLYYSIREALQSGYIERVVVSTEDKAIAEIADRYGAEVIARPQELARDDTPSLPVIQHAISYLEEGERFRPDIVVVLQPTSPLRTAQDIDEAVGKLLDTGCDSVVGVCEVEHPLHLMYLLEEEDRLKPVISGGEKITRRQDAPGVYRLNGAVYVSHRDVLMKQGLVFGADTRAYIMPPERSIDIDTELDFEIAEFLMGKRSEGLTGTATPLL